VDRHPEKKNGMLGQTEAMHGLNFSMWEVLKDTKVLRSAMNCYNLEKSLMGLLLMKHLLDLLVNNLADNGSPSVQDYSAQGEDDSDRGDGPRIRDGSPARKMKTLRAWIKRVVQIKIGVYKALDCGLWTEGRWAGPEAHLWVHTQENISNAVWFFGCKPEAQCQEGQHVGPKHGLWACRQFY
jgi:hypothetical protein